MKHIFILLAVLVFTFTIQAQVPVPMSSQPALTYTETFDSIGFWTNGFASGPGVERFAPVLPGGINPIPDPTRIITSSATFTTGSSGGLHIDSAGGRLLMLVTGTTNNTSSLAFDFFMDFSGINAGTLSFDWQTVFNGATSSNRTGTLRVYASTDGINFTELSGATVTVTNYVPGTGTVSVTLPASFNNNPDARLRFYYYNSAGGTTGSRPLIALDNLKIIAAGQPCSTPSASPTTLAFTNITATSFDASFTAANPSPDEYVVIITANNNLTANPPDGYVFNPGDNVGDGIVVYRGSNTSFSAQNLDPQTNYTVYVFSLNIYCNGTISYRTSDPLTNTITTPAGPPCVTPSAQPGNLQFTNVTASSITGTFNSVADASEYLVLQSTSPVASVPINGTVYFPGDQIGTATVVYRGGANSFTSLALNHSTTYYFKIFSLNNFACSNGPVYQTSAPLSGQQATQIVPPCQAPAHNAWNLILLPGEHEITGFFNPYNDAADSYLVVMSTNSSLSAFPQDGLNYAPGSALGNATVVSTGSNFCFATSGLATNTTYHFFVFSYNHLCIGGPLYRTGGYLSGSTTTTTAQPFNYYFGNLHAHSSFSDGNQDNPSLTAADNYAYAKNSLCMDFLGISEHNHFTANNNPGMLLQYYHQGLSEASAFNNANPDFLALFGMEWGTLTDGGHALVYGIDSLIGWETLNGAPNYDIYVPKNDFLSPNGLFRKVNQFSSSNAFATLAHPSFHDFGQLLQSPYNPSADSAIVGVAVESGPAFSTSDNYSEPGSSMSSLYYYETLLSKGYRVAPMIDHDNHNTNFGRTAHTRTGVIAPSLNKTSFLEAVRSMRMFATQSCDTRAAIHVYGHPMGSTVQHRYAPAITVSATDPSDPSTIPVIRLISGVPGSSIPPVAIKTDTAYFLSYTDHSLPDSGSAYYYADITIAGKRTITAPVWYTRRDTTFINNLNTLNTTDRGVTVKNNPAPEKAIIEISTPATESVEITVAIQTGQQIFRKTTIIQPGTTEIPISLSGQPAGLYIISVRFDTEIITRKILHL